MRALFIGLLFVLSVEADSLTSAQLKTLTFTQRIGGQVSLNQDFADEHGRSVRLRDYIGQHPTILILGYYECPMLCNLVLNGVVESLQEIKSGSDSNTRLIFISIDPRETCSLALRKKKTYLQRFGRPGTDERWHFLTGRQEAVGQVAQEVGFSYLYDESHRQYVHPSGIVILTPEGRVSRYFFGVSYPSAEIQAALREATQQHTGSPIRSLVILCSRFVPLTGKFSGIVLGAVRVMAIVTILCLIGIPFVVKRANARRQT